MMEEAPEPLENAQSNSPSSSTIAYDAVSNDDGDADSITFSYPEYGDVHRARIVSVRPSKLPDFVTCECAGDGDCQFSAVAQALNAYNGTAYAALREHLNAIKLGAPGDLTALDLREAACMLFLVDTPFVLPYLEHWKRQPLEGTNAASAFLQHRRLDILSAQERAQLFTILMQRSCCWGDDVTLALLERVLRVRIDVFTPAGSLIKRDEITTVPKFVPIVFVALQLTMMHYETLAVQIPQSTTETAPVFPLITAWTADLVPRVIIDATHALFDKDAPFRTMFDAWRTDASTTLDAHVDDEITAIIHAAEAPLREYHAHSTSEQTPKRTAYGYKDVDIRDAPFGVTPPCEFGFASRDGMPSIHVPTANVGRVVADGGHRGMSMVPMTSVAYLQCGMPIHSK